MKLPNLFDPYEQAENQLTNALVQTLGRNPLLAKDFAERLLGRKLKGRIDTSVQIRPSEVADTNVKVSVPDAWVVGDDLSVALESKIVPGAVAASQLKRHLTQIPAPGMLVVLTPDEREPAAVREVFRPEGVDIVWLSWRDVHSWASRLLRGKRLKAAEFLLENFKEYLEMKDLAGFTGIDLHERYEYPRAKAILKALVIRLAPRVASLYPGMRPAGRPIKDDRAENGAPLVWLPLSESENFTSIPHFTVALFGPFTRLALTVPNGARPAWRRVRTLLESNDRLFSLLRASFQSVQKGQRRNLAPTVSFRLFQRHWVQRALPPVRDAEIQYDLATFFPSSQTQVCRNRGWWQASSDIIRHGDRGANWEMQIAVDYSNKDSRVQSPQFVDELLRVLRAFRPLYVKLRG